MCLRRFPTAISSTAPHGPLLYLILLLILLAAGCNSSNQPASPHIPTYTTIDILGASGSIVGAVDSRVSHSFLRAPDGTFTILIHRELLVVQSLCLLTQVGQSPEIFRMQAQATMAI